MRLVLLMLLLVACGQEERSNTKFITYRHKGVIDKALNHRFFLISKVHRQELNIGYGFAANEDCQWDSFTGIEEGIRADMTDMLNLWLEPLRKSDVMRQPLVDEFIFTRFQAAKVRRGGWENKLVGENTDRIQGNLDLHVIFYCREGSGSYVLHNGIPSLHLRRASGKYPSTRTPYDLSVFLHELGHTFGLMDTYAYFGLVNTGSYEETIGKQPLSIMSSNTLTNDDGDLILGVDDKKGMIWLYSYYYAPGNLPTNNCYFPNYELETYKNVDNGIISGSGCIPKNPLIFQFKQGHVDMIISAIKSQTININEKESSGQRLSAVHYAAMFGNAKVIRAMLVHEDLNINVQATDGMTALHYAVQSGNSGAVAALLASPSIDVGIADKRKFTPLHVAVQYGQIESVRHLLDHSDVDIKIEDKWHLTPQQRAHNRINHWQLEKQKLLKNSASQSDIDQAQQMIDNMQAIINLLVAFDAGSIEENTQVTSAEPPPREPSQLMMVNVLQGLKRGDDAGIIARAIRNEHATHINAHDNASGNSALHYAVRRGYTTVVDALMNRTDFLLKNLPNKKGNTALHIAAINNRVKIARLLLQDTHLAITIRNLDQRTPLHLAARYGSVGVIKALMFATRTRLNLRDKYGDTALHKATLHGHLEAVRELLKNRNTKVNLRNNHGYTSMHLAAKRGHAEIARALLRRRGLKTNIRNKYKSTALHYAARFGHTEIVQLLLSRKGTKINLLDNQRRTPRNWARRNGHDEIVRLLDAHN